ncbi:MAG: hypothetical protein LLF94_06155 [Chlamydiales bacterium]|nr:hypothetical protein [Chlamydiales bacterium]
MMPILNPNGPYVITIIYNGGVERHACRGFTLYERPNSSPAERYQLEWVDVLRNQREAFMVCSYERSPDGRKYTIVNDFQHAFIFESRMFQT